LSTLQITTISPLEILLVGRRGRHKWKMKSYSIVNQETGKIYKVNTSLTQPEKEIILAGGKINQIKGE
jgi:hypothetical protein